MAIIKINNNAIDLDAAEIPNLDAAKITTGQFADAKIADVASSKITGTITPSDATVTTAKIADGAVTAAKLASGVGGKVLQVVSAVQTAGQTTTATSFTTMNLSANITPSSTSSKIYVVASFGAYHASPYNAGSPAFTLYKDSTNLGDTSNGMAGLYFNAAGAITAPATLSILNSPSTTSQVTYALYAKTPNASYAVGIGANYNAQAGTSSITLMEISG